MMCIFIVDILPSRAFLPYKCASSWAVSICRMLDSREMLERASELLHRELFSLANQNSDLKRSLVDFLSRHSRTTKRVTAALCQFPRDLLPRRISWTARGPITSLAAQGTDFYMTSLNAQAVINEWNNGINLVDIFEVLLPQARLL